jgi:glucokinase
MRLSQKKELPLQKDKQDKNSRNISGTGLVLGIDIGGTKTKIGSFSGSTLVVHSHFPTPQDPQQAASTLIEEIKKVPGTESGRLAGIGIGCPGPLSQETGEVLSPPNLQKWVRFPIVRLLEDEFQAPVLLENDGNAGALGEAVFGSGKGYNTVFYCTISTGIGIGIVINGAVHQGYKGLAGETWAFEPENYFGKSSGTNILDRSAGNGIVRIAAEALVEAAREGRSSCISQNEVTTRTILAALEAGDSIAVEIFEQARDILAGMLVNAMTLLAPDIVVLAGGLCTDPSWYVEPIRERVRKWMPIRELADTPINRAELWDSAVLYGAVSMVAQVL